MERFCDPYIPKSRVKRAFVSQLMPDSLISELNDMGIRTYKLGKTKNISSELSFHPDILLNNVDFPTLGLPTIATIGFIFILRFILLIALF
jgi:hypothetical protein